MASGSSIDSCNQLLIVEWKSGRRDVVFIGAVVSPLDKELIIGDTIVVNRFGGPEEAKLVARTRAHVRLDAMLSQSMRKASPPTAGHSVKLEPKDFCPSTSSWVLSSSDDEDTLSADSDEIPEKKNKLKQCKRQYSHDTKEMFKDLFKSIREIKQSLLKSAISKHRIILFRPESLDQARPAPTPYNETIRILNQTEPAAFRKTVEYVTEGEEINSDHTDLNRSGDNVLITNELTNTAVKTVQNEVPEDSELIPEKKNKLKQCKRQYSHETKEMFKDLFKSIREIKQSLLKSATSKHRMILFRPESLNQAPPAPTPYNETIRILNQTEPAAFRKTVEYVTEGEEINSDHTELNRSGDNVLITNKIFNAAVKTVQYKVPEDSEWVPIGSGKTLIYKSKFKKVKWTSYTIATRTLLLAVFSRRVLATHSLMGKKSPAFQNKPAKMCLDPKITTDIIYEVMDRFNVKENLVRSVIITKCADECKMWKNRHNKK